MSAHSIGFQFPRSDAFRSYTPTRPNTASEKNGSFDLVVMTYFPDERQPEGAMSNILDCMPIGEEIEIRGPTSETKYHGNGKFTIEGKEKVFKKVSLVLGGSGVTPGYALIKRILQDGDDRTEISAVDASKMEMDEFAKKHGKQFRVCHVLRHPSEEWKGMKGYVDRDIIKDNLFSPNDGKESVVLLCGPPAMIQKAALLALEDWGYEEVKNCFGF